MTSDRTYGYEMFLISENIKLNGLCDLPALLNCHGYYGILTFTFHPLIP